MQTLYLKDFYTNKLHLYLLLQVLLQNLLMNYRKEHLFYDNNGNMLGNDNLYSNSKRAGIVMGTESGECTEANYNVVEYDTAKLGTNLSVGSYYVVFYDNSGKDICNGYIYVRGK
jgi:hypothetical protein